MAAQSKLDAVKQLTEKLKDAKAMVLVDYRGINVNEDTELRRKARETGIDYFVAKNRLVKIALQEVGVEANFDDLLEGTTSFALGYEDGIAPSKLVYDFGKTLKDKFVIKGGMLDGARVDAATIESLAKLPSREEMLGQVAYGLMSPIRMLAVALSNLSEQKNEGEKPAEVVEATVVETAAVVEEVKEVEAVVEEKTAEAVTE